MARHLSHTGDPNQCKYHTLTVNVHDTLESTTPTISPIQEHAINGPPDSIPKRVTDERNGLSQTRDLEKGSVPASEETHPHASPTVSSDTHIVDWDGPNDPQNPRNWSRKKKWIVTSTVSCFTLMSPLASSMVAPALPQITKELHMKPGSVLEAMIVSIFVLAYALGPLFLAPLSELHGRTSILLLSNLFFLVFNIACARAQTPTQLLVFRFFAGLGGCAPQTIGGGTVSDLFSNEERGLAMSVYSIAPLCGPALGPLFGGFIAQYSSWRWVFYATSIADGVVQIGGFIFLRETYGPKILADKAKRLRKSTGNPKLRTSAERPDRTIAKVLGHGLRRPLMFLATEPILQVLGLYLAVLYGLMYLVLTTFASLWSDRYHQSLGIAGLHYLALGIGFAIGAQGGARILDRTYSKLKAKNGGIGQPEMRMPLMMVTVFLIPCGFILYGWSAQYTVFWLVPDIGAFLFSIGILGAFLSTQTYIIDNFHVYAASALAAINSTRSLFAFAFPLFANTMYSKLGVGWGNSVLALVAFIFVPAPFFFYKYGPWLRSKSRHTRR